MSSIKILDHLLATILYRFNKAISLADSNYPDFNAGSGVRTPIQIVNHMTADLKSAKRHLLYPEEKMDVTEIQSWETEVSRFRSILREVSEALHQKQYDEKLLLRLTQGPVSDVLTHIGQLATLSRLNGQPVPGENFMKPDISIKQVR